MFGCHALATRGLGAPPNCFGPSAKQRHSFDPSQRHALSIVVAAAGVGRTGNEGR